MNIIIIVMLSIILFFQFILMINQCIEERKLKKAKENEMDAIKTKIKNNKKYKKMVKIQIIGFLVTIIMSVIFFIFLEDGRAAAECSGGLTGLFIIFLIGTEGIKQSVNLEKEEFMLKYNLYYNNEKDHYYGKSMMSGKDVIFNYSFKKIRDYRNRVVSSFTVISYFIEVENIEQIDKIINKPDFEVEFLQNFIEDFIVNPNVSVTDNKLVITAVIDSYLDFDAVTKILMIYKTYEKSESLAQLIIDEARSV